jgi:hypothetical protein
MIAKWDNSTDPRNPGWVVLCHVGEEDVWMPPAPGWDLPADADRDEIADMVAATVAYQQMGVTVTVDEAVPIEIREETDD